MRFTQKLSWLILGTVTVFSFQNCGKPFHSASESSLSTSAKCTAKMREEAASYKLSAKELACGDFNAYACERRIFSPEVSDLTESIKECVGSGNICVDVDVRQYNTATARNQNYTDASSFLPGGDYNHEEVRCHHKMVYRGTVIFEGASDSLEDSLARAMAACEQAVGT